MSSEGKQHQAALSAKSCDFSSTSRCSPFSSTFGPYKEIQDSIQKNFSRLTLTSLRPSSQFLLSVRRNAFITTRRTITPSAVSRTLPPQHTLKTQHTLVAVLHSSSLKHKRPSYLLCENLCCLLRHCKLPHAIFTVVAMCDVAMGRYKTCSQTPRLRLESRRRGATSTALKRQDEIFGVLHSGESYRQDCFANHVTAVCGWHHFPTLFLSATTLWLWSRFVWLFQA